jgi:hypothetical protein
VNKYFNNPLNRLTEDVYKIDDRAISSGKPAALIRIMFGEKPAVLSGDQIFGAKHKKRLHSCLFDDQGLGGASYIKRQRVFDSTIESSIYVDQKGVTVEEGVQDFKRLVNVSENKMYLNVMRSKQMFGAQGDAGEVRKNIEERLVLVDESETRITIRDLDNIIMNIVGSYDEKMLSLEDQKLDSEVWGYMKRLCLKDKNPHRKM